MTDNLIRGGASLILALGSIMWLPFLTMDVSLFELMPNTEMAVVVATLIAGVGIYDALETAEIVEYPPA